MKDFYISIFLDTRRTLKTGKYPVKLRVFTSKPRMQKLYPTKFELTEQEFKSTWESVKTRNEHKEIKRKMQLVENSANDIAGSLEVFNFDQFEKKFLRKVGEGENVIYQYNLYIAYLKEQGQIRTANNYESSLKSIKEYIQNLKGKETDKILFSEITPKWLNGYEKYMTSKPKNLSKTTVSMYLRALRTIFNKAIDENEIEKEIYPFGKRKYLLPSVKAVKKALQENELKLLFESKPLTPEQEKAKDFWFFSYSCNGMNIKDIAQIKLKDIENDKIVYYRAKTINTSKADLKPIIVYLTDYSLSIINKYGTKSTAKENFVFDIINDKQSIEEQSNKIKNFTKFINQNLKKLSKNIGITTDISTYWARHTFATNAIRKGASMEFVSEALNHSNMKVTQGYFSGFGDNQKKEFQNLLMNF